eukprot:6355900-Pyramimonas_sp.AAC.1
MAEVIKAIVLIRAASRYLDAVKVAVIKRAKYMGDMEVRISMTVHQKKAKGRKEFEPGQDLTAISHRCVGRRATSIISGVSMGSHASLDGGEVFIGVGPAAVHREGPGRCGAEEDGLRNQ